MTTRPAHDPVHRPSHYVGLSGRQSIEITHAWRLGPDLTQAVDYILRAGRKTPDPRQDLGKAVFYLRYAAQVGRDFTFGHPLAVWPDAVEVAIDFGLDPHCAAALALVLRPYPTADDCLAAALHVDLAIDSWTAANLPAANSGRAA